MSDRIPNSYQLPFFSKEKARCHYVKLHNSCYYLGCNKEKDNKVYAKYGYCQRVKENGWCTLTVFKDARQEGIAALFKKKCAFTCFQCPGTILHRYARY